MCKLRYLEKDVRHWQNLRDAVFYAGHRTLKDTGNLKISGEMFDMRSKWLPHETFFPPSLRGFQNDGFIYCREEKIIFLFWIKGYRIQVNITKEILILKLRYVLSLKL